MQFVTSEIKGRMGEMGVTVFMPHTINRDMMKRLTEYGDSFALTAKDKRQVRMAEKHLEWINYEIDNPLPDFYLRELYEKDVFMVAWKISDLERHPVADVLHNFIDYLCKPQEIANDPSDPPIVMPPIMKPYQIMVDDEELERFLEMENESDRLIRERYRSVMVHRDADETKEEEEEVDDMAQLADEEPPDVEVVTNVEDEQGEEGEGEEEETEQDDVGLLMDDVLDNLDDGANTDSDDDDDDDNNKAKRKTGASVVFQTKPIEEEEAEEEEEREPDLRTNKLFMMPVWTPYNNTAQAALVYLYFRNVCNLYCFCLSTY